MGSVLFCPVAGVLCEQTSAKMYTSTHIHEQIRSEFCVAKPYPTLEVCGMITTSSCHPRTGDVEGGTEVRTDPIPSELGLGRGVRFSNHSIGIVT